eukprot:708298-Amphidinium_carterae.1
MTRDDDHHDDTDELFRRCLGWIGSALELRSYDLVSRDALKAMALLAEGARQLDSQNETSRKKDLAAQPVSALTV